jgi:outer membrane receptor protein involved in Fe transport
VGDDLRLGQRVQLKAAVRVDDHLDSFGVAVDPRLALIVRPYDGGNTKLIYGTAFRAPSMVERFFQDGLTQVQAHGLQPERVTTGEFEHTHQLGSDVSLLVAGYFSKIEQLIRLKQLAKSTQFAFSNRSTLTHSAGLEGELRWQPAPGALLALWYSFAHVTDDNGHVVPNSPSHTGALRVLCPVVPALLSLSTEAVYGSVRDTATDAANPDQEVGASLHWNAGLSGESARLGLRYGAFVENILDERPLVPAGLEVPFPGHAVPQLGRTIRVQLGAAF